MSESPFLKEGRILGNIFRITEHGWYIWAVLEQWSLQIQGIISVPTIITVKDQSGEYLQKYTKW